MNKITKQQSRIIADIILHHLEELKTLGKLEKLVSEDRAVTALMDLSKEIQEYNKLPKSYLDKEERAYKTWYRTGNIQDIGGLPLARSGD